MLEGEKVIKLSNGKKLGVVCRDLVFRIFGRDEKKHLFRIYNGWALNKELLEDLRNMHVEFIEIHTKQGNIYKTNIVNFFDKEKAIYYKNTKGEKDIQLVLPLSFWFKKKKRGNLRDILPAEEELAHPNTLKKYVSKTTKK